MSGLSSFRLGAPVAAPTTPTSYSGSYATTQQDARDKCQGNVVASVMRTAASSNSLVEAIQRAKQLAIDAIVCPVFSASYTTTPQDYIDVCGAGTSGASVTRSATSGKDQPAADATAKANARAAIVCPVPFPAYSTALSLSQPSDPSGEVTLTLADSYADGVFRFNATPGGDSTPKSMSVLINGGQAFLVDFPATYTGTPTGWTFTTPTHRYQGTMTDGTATATQYS